MDKKLYGWSIGHMGHTDEITTLRRAATLVGRSPETVRSWCRKYNLAVRDGHRLRIDRAALLRVAKAHDDADALLRGIL